MIITPVPPVPNPTGTGETIKKIIKVVKFIKETFWDPSKEGGKSDSINNNASLENVDRIINIFSDFKDQVHVKAAEIEMMLEKEVNYYAEELKTVLEEHFEKTEKYGIHIARIERQVNKIAARIKGTIDDELSKNVSLDNAECKEIVKMIPGLKKEAAMNAFFNNAVDRALEACCAEMRLSLDEIYEDVESEVIGTITSIQTQNEKLKEQFSNINESDYEMTAKEQMVNAFYLTDICDAVQGVLQRGD